MVNIVRSVKVIKPDDGVINTNTGDSFKIYSVTCVEESYYKIFLDK